MMQSCASAAKLRSGGPILPVGMKAKGLVGVPPPRTVIGAPSQACGQGRNYRDAFNVLRLLCRTHNDAVRDNTLSHEPPQGDQKLACQGHDHGLVWSFRCQGVCQAANLCPSSFFLFDLKDRFFARPALRPGRRAVKVGRCTNLAACSAFIRPYLDRFEGDGTLTRSG